MDELLLYCLFLSRTHAFFFYRCRKVHGCLDAFKQSRTRSKQWRRYVQKPARRYALQNAGLGWSMHARKKREKRKQQTCGNMNVLCEYTRCWAHRIDCNFTVLSPLSVSVFIQANERMYGAVRKVQCTWHFPGSALQRIPWIFLLWNLPHLFDIQHLVATATSCNVRGAQQMQPERLLFSVKLLCII